MAEYKAGIRLTGDASGFVAAAKQSTRATVDLVQTLNDSTSTIKRLNEVLLQVGKSTAVFNDMNARLGQVAKSTQEASSSTKTLVDHVSSMGHAGAGLFALTALADKVWETGKAMVTTRIETERLQMRLNAAFGDSAAGKVFSDLRESANRLGLNLQDTAAAYGKFSLAARGTSLEGDAAQRVFTSVAKATSVMGLSAEETNGVFLALQQMISKGTVQSEELRGQLSERLPGAFQIAARSMGVTTQQLGKMLEAGQVLTTDFLPKFAKQLDTDMAGAMSKAGQTTEASLNRLGNAWGDVKRSFSDTGGKSFLAGQMDILADGLNSVGERMRKTKDAGGGFAAQMVTGAGAVMQFLNPFNLLSYSAQSLDGKLLAANEDLKILEAQLGKGAKNWMLEGAIADTKRLIEELGKAKAASTGGGQSFRALDNGTMQTYTRQEQERDQDITNRLAETKGKLLKNDKEYLTGLRALNDGYTAGKIGLSEYQSLMAKLINTQGGGEEMINKARQAADGRIALAKASADKETTIQELQLDRQLRAEEVAYQSGLKGKDSYLMARATLENRAFDLQRSLIEREIQLEKSRPVYDPAEGSKSAAKVKDLEKRLVEIDRRRVKVDDGGADFDAAVKASEDAVKAEAAKRRIEAGIANETYFADLQGQTRTINAGLIQDERARAQALLAIEKASMTARLGMIAEGSDQRKVAEQALNDYLAAKNAELAMKFQPGWQQLIAGWGDTMQMVRTAHDEAMLNVVRNGESAFIEWAKTGKLNARSLVDSILDELLRLEYRKNIAKPLSGAVDGLLGQLFGGGGGFGTGSSFGNQDLGQFFHSGGVVGGAPTFTRPVGSGLFAGAPRFHTGGIAGDEVPIIAKRGEGVFTPAQMAALAPAGATSMIVNVINQTSTPVQAQVQKSPDGQTMQIILREVGAALGEEIGAGVGPINAALQGRYGLSPALG